MTYLSILLVSMAAMTALWIRVVGISLSLSSVMIGGLLVLHGPAYIYYTREWGPGFGLMRELYTRMNVSTLSQQTVYNGNFFDLVLAVAPGRDVIGELDLALSLLFVSLCIGILLSDRVFGNDCLPMRKHIDSWNRTVFQPVSPRALTWIASTLALAAATALAFALQEDQVGRVLLYLRSNAGEFEKIAMRRELGGSNFYLYNLALAAVLPLLALWALALVPQAPYRMGPIALVLIITVLLGKLSMLSKAPPAFFCLQLMVLAFVWRQLAFKPIHLLALGAVALVLLVGMSMVANVHLRNPFNSLIFLFYRVFMIPNESLVEYFSAIPSVIEHTAGREISWVAALLQTDPLPATYSRVADVFRNPKGASTTNAMFLGDAWAAFSWMGVGIVGFVAGFVLRAIDTVLIARLGKSPATVAALTAGLFGVFVALSTAFQTALVTGGLLLLVPFALLVRQIQKSFTP